MTTKDNFTTILLDVSGTEKTWSGQVVVMEDEGWGLLTLLGRIFISLWTQGLTSDRPSVNFSLSASEAVILGCMLSYFLAFA